MSPESAGTRRGRVVAHYGVAILVEIEAGERRSFPIRRGSRFVVGEWVSLEGDHPEALPAEGVLRRRDAKGRTRVIAANLDVLGIVVAYSPRTPRGFVDRALVAANSEGIEPVLIVNKMDLPEAESLADTLEETYSGDADVLRVTASTGEGLDTIRERLWRGKLGAFVGPSGVGKSSLMNALLPDLDLAVGELNRASGQGTHVTTVATLHSIEGGGELIDTPGFREFGPVEVDVAAVAAYFPGLGDARTRPCRFRDCLHRSEPGCAVLAALEEGLLEPERHRRYLGLLGEIEEVARSERRY